MVWRRVRTPVRGGLGEVRKDVLDRGLQRRARAQLCAQRRVPALQQAAQHAHLGLYPVVTLEKQLLA
jgi:hypothetical protein